MHTLSAFQLLPEHVVKLIVDHVADCSRLHYGDICSGSEEYKLHQIPLLWVCHNFRAFICARFCGKCELQLDEGGDGYVDSRPSWPPCLRKLDYPTHHLAKDLYLNLSIWSIYTGTALQQLSSAPYEDCAFPLVRQLTIGLCLGDKLKQISESRPPTSLDSYPPDTTANIAAFVQRVRQMVPNIRKVDVGPDPSVQQLVVQRNAHIMDLIQQLYDIVKAKSAITYNSESLVEYLDLEPIRNLVHVAYRINDTSSRIMPLIRHSAQTLQSLDLSGTVHVDYTELIRDPDSGGRWLEYPCLHTLRLFSDYENAILRGSISNGAVPFPQLRRLAMRWAYPFGDDVLFRGNTATLEYLKIVLDSELVAMLKQRNIFTPTSHPKLKCVNINLCSSDASGIFAAAAEYLQFALSIAPRTSVLAIPSLSSFGGTLTTELEMLGNHNSLQVLSLYRATLSFWDIVNLIKSLPLLSDLKTGVPTMGELPQGVTLAQLPEYARSTYAPMGKRFRCWHISLSPLTKLGNLATCVLVLALICPNFDYAAMGGRHHEQFMQEMKRQIAEPWFIQHVPRLRRLLFNGCNDCLAIN
ncbi:hypothetical protein GGF42_007502 [Coemansia sp. RSA 2424]|nr:hypothetical protein GGF42_007502 [Coemansia sp. RSA 2424]